MAELTLQQIEQFRANVRANRHEHQIQIYEYNGAEQALTFLIDQLRSQEIKEASNAITPEEFVERMKTAGVTGPGGEPVEFVSVRDAEGNIIYPNDNESVAGVVMPEEE